MLQNDFCYCLRVVARKTCCVRPDPSYTDEGGQRGAEKIYKFTKFLLFFRRLRDRLVDSERYTLSIDVTGKCGLEPSTVWFAWGISQLNSGDLIGARENFAKCLTVSTTLIYLKNYNIIIQLFVQGLPFQQQKCSYQQGLC